MKTWLFAFVFLISFSEKNTPEFDAFLQRATAENKSVLLIFSGSDWCRACINFKTNVLDSETFRTYADENLLIYTADLPRDESKFSPEKIAEHKALAEKYNAKGVFPYLVLFSAQGEIIKQKAGAFANTDDFVLWLNN